MKNPRNLFAVAVPRSIVWIEADSVDEAIARLSDDCDGAASVLAVGSPAATLLAQIEPEAPDAAEIQSLRG